MDKEIANNDLFKFMTKIYGKMQEGFNRVEKHIVSLENKMDTNHKCLYDRYKLAYEKLNILE